MRSSLTAENFAAPINTKQLSRSRFHLKVARIAQTLQGSQDQHYGSSVTALLHPDLLSETEYTAIDSDLVAIANLASQSFLAPEVKVAKVLALVRDYLAARRSDIKNTIDWKLQQLLNPILHDLATLQAEVNQAESLVP